MSRVKGTNMEESVFYCMVAGEHGDVEVIEKIKNEMGLKDSIGIYPYTITSPRYEYTIIKPNEPLFSMYGTQYTATQTHK